jgi:8-oxo-dGTP pyrophosphatase MutT (NUDIX family)
LPRTEYSFAAISPAAQVGALPFRRTADGRLEILLITSRGSGRWIIPKGWPIRNLSHDESAAREALEEAGLAGRVAPKPIGTFEYEKRLKRGSSTICSVEVYPMLVQEARDHWQEFGERELRWCSPEQALALVAEDGLREIIKTFTGLAHR